MIYGAMACCALTPMDHLAAQQTPPPSSAPPFPFDPAVRTGVLPNGLRYYIRANKKPENIAEFRLIVNAGSLQEDDDQQGLAHFLEHMAFNGTKNFPKHKLIDYLESTGMRFGAHLNAFTDFSKTGYILSIPADNEKHLETAIQILEDWAHNITLDSVEIVAERGVVLAERRQRLGAGSRVSDAHLSKIFYGSRYVDRLPIGKPEVIQNASYDGARRFYRDWYRPDLMAVVVVGPFNVDQMEARIKKHFSILKNPANPRPKAADRVPINDEPLVSIVSDPEETSRTVTIAFKDTVGPSQTAASYRTELIRGMADAMINARLQEISVRPNAPFFGAGIGWSGLTQYEVTHSLNISLKNEDYIGATNAALNEVVRAAQHGFLPSELAREKTKHVRGMEQMYLERSNVQSASFAESYIEHFLTGKPTGDIATEVAFMKKVLGTISLQDVNAAAKAGFPKRGRLVTVTTPERKPGSAPVPSGAEFLAAVDAAAQHTLEPYVELASSLPLLSALPTPGTIVAEKEYRDLGITEWTLSNGARVLLKPTNFREDDILVSAVSPGGLYMLPDSDVISGQFINGIVGLSGYGNLSSEQLQKRMAGKLIAVQKSIGHGTEAINGRTSPKDLESFFQAMYAVWTQPRYDSVMVASMIENMRISLENAKVNPMRAFSDTMQVTTTQHSPRHPLTTPELLDRMDPKRAVQLYRERFAGASDFTFVIVGSFTPNDIKPFVTQYIGGLPVGQKEEVPDRGVRAPSGIVKKVVYGGREPKSHSIVTFHGPCVANTTTAMLADEVVRLNVLGEIVKHRLLQRLREEMSGTYGVAVQAGIGLKPVCGFTFSSEFVTDPVRREEITQAFFAVMDDLRTNAPTEEEVERVRAALLRGAETSRTTNEAWMQVMGEYLQVGWPLEQMWDETRVNALTPAMVLDAAKRYLPKDNYMHFILDPEPGQTK